MSSLSRVNEILDEAVNSENFAAHGPFWRGLTRDQFVAKVVFGKKVIATKADGTFDPDESNLIKALEGRAPFGKDVVPPPPGAILPRMPLGYAPVQAGKIQEIRAWIQAGCPETAVANMVWVDNQAGGPVAPESYLAFWRDFDNWAMFHASEQTGQDINAFFTIADTWLRLAGGSASESQWAAALLMPGVSDAVRRLSVLQRDTIVQHFGRPAPLLTLADCFEKFGDDSLPDDALRPVAPRHNMNGEVMWFYWAAFIDACRRLSGTVPEISVAFWDGMAKVILIGLLNDGLFRGRFTVSGFSADAQGKNNIRDHALALPDAGLITELLQRCRDGGFSV
jgi:hypothetical protein